MEIVTHRRRRPRDSPSLDKVNKNVPTRTSRGTCEAITGGPGRIFSIVFPLLLPPSTSTSLLCPARRVTAAFINAESRYRRVDQSYCESRWKLYKKFHPRPHSSGIGRSEISFRTRTIFATLSLLIVKMEIENHVFPNLLRRFRQYHFL